MTTSVKVQGRLSVGPRGRRSTVWGFRQVILNFAERDLKAQYKSTILGWLWSIIVPLMNILVFTLVFSVIYRVTPPPMGNGDPGNYALFLVSGMVAWNFLSGSLQRGIGGLAATAAMMKKIYLPAFVPVFGTVCALFVQLMVEMGIVLTIMLLVGNGSLTWLVLPVWLVIFTPFVAALSLVLAVVNVYVRDVSLLTAVLLQVLFFLSAVIYPIDFVPEYMNGFPLQAAIELSPFTQCVVTMRDIVYSHQIPVLQLGYLALWSGAVVAVALFVYHRWGRDAGELL